jgi:hypothetical protein
VKKFALRTGPPFLLQSTHAVGWEIAHEKLTL